MSAARPKKISFGLEPQVLQNLVPQDDGEDLDLAKPACKTWKRKGSCGLSSKLRTAFILGHLRVQTYVKAFIVLHYGVDISNCLR